MRKTRKCQLSRVLLGSLIVAVFAFASNGCNTVQGIGEDITGVGKAGEDVITD